MSDWFDDLDTHPSWEQEETNCSHCGNPTDGKTYCSKGCKIADNE